MKSKGQATIEFAFVMIAIIFLIYGTFRVFRWAGMDLAERRLAQDKSLVVGNTLAALDHNTEAFTSVTAATQLQPDFYRTKRINAVYHGNVAK